MKAFSQTNTPGAVEPEHHHRHTADDAVSAGGAVAGVNPEASGRTYWRSLDQLAETPEFRQFLEREFPEGATEFADPVSRRHFVKIMSASFLLAGFGLSGTGCRRPEDKLMPFGKATADYTHGVPKDFATAMPTRGGAIPLVVKSHEGRPVKIEGNTRYPGGNGSTDRYTQASILNLYDPDRAKRFTHKGNAASSEAALGFLGELAAKLKQTGGEGFSFLLEPGTSPSRKRLQKLISDQFPKVRWYAYDPVDHAIHERAATQAFGQAVRPVFRYDEAKVVLSLDCDFIGAEEDAHNNIRRFTKGRKIARAGDTMNRLYAVESLFTLTGLNADHRLRLPASSVLSVAAAVAAQCGVSLSGIPQPAVEDAKWITECAKDLLANRGAALVVAGIGQPLAVHLIAQAINSALGSVGKTVQLLPSIATQAGTLSELAQALNAGQVDTLVMLGGNPAYSAPADLDWSNTQRKAKTVVRLGYYEDETAVACDWHFPQAHYLESWGDALTTDGTYVPVQPLISPLFGGLTELEFLTRLAGATVTRPYEIVQATFDTFSNGGLEVWKKFLHDGFLAVTTAKPVTAGFSAAAVTRAVAAAKPATPNKDNLEVILHRDYSVDDGRFANNGWLQEFPDPITKITWDNAVLVSRTTARELGVKNTDVVEVKLGDRAIKGVIWTQPGMADFSLGIALGYGRQRAAGRVGQEVGFNAYPLLTTQTGCLAVGATLRKTGEAYPISCTQDHWSMEGRAIVREANLEQFNQHPDFAHRMNAPEAPDETPLYPNPLDEAMKTALHQWGMSIDLSSCVGCGTCVLACQSENNIPIVGKDQVKRGREMHWLRIDRYYTTNPAQRSWKDVYRKDEAQQFEPWIDDVQAVNQPMLCQHCEAAPCESVCPVNATVHDQEGLNVMVYNRCVGTRYCSNNCPYKVRRFNYLDYNKRPLEKLKGPFYASPLTHKTDGKWDLLRWWKDPESGMREEDEWDLIRMIKNPDVTVRMRGVMEKCTFCVQRIEQAKIAQKVKAGASGDVVVPDGTFTTACAQACPAEAIVFGNVADPNSRVSKLKQQQRDYSVLEFLKTKPRLTYLARVRNPNPAMPDYEQNPMPHSLQEFAQKNHIEGDPFAGHHGSPPKPGSNGHAPAGKGGH
ncbi:MAG: TAT-variant-translocated molybdopterin oxidoreductase [Verrucomicrobia bacterium]|nr:TAT-variant-translocated molybdopterin oxidoreductase [Verrucomicrobiota bacterium]